MNIPNARLRILEVAVSIFAEKSFEGSRIDEIAKAANVPKSLIYYHFKSKEDILQQLTENFINAYVEILEMAVADKSELHSTGMIERMQTVYHDFGVKYQDLVRVMFIDSLKKSKKTPILYKVIEAMIEKEAALFNLSKEDVQERRIAEFFTSLIPSYAYLCFADSWTQYFSIDRKQFDHNFLKAYDQTHGAYHRQREHIQQ